jgi:exopolysaccharide biosynthesis WecB/TagA/CpsF family protein
MLTGSGVPWPSKYDLFGVGVSATTYDELLDRVVEAASRGVNATVDHMPVHGLVEAVRSPALKRALNGFSVVAPDGQPVRWALNVIHGLALRDRVYGPEFMTRLCRRAADHGHRVYLFGGSPRVVVNLKARLEEMVPALSIVGCESPPYRELTFEEDRNAVARISRSGARIVFLGLGCPKQEIFAHQHQQSLDCVQICVGAAFDFLSGEKRMAPKWMQDRGLEWLFRLLSEPRRLHGRYLRTNSAFMWLFARELWKKRKLHSSEDLRQH